MIRDRELERIRKYCQGLGITLKLLSKSDDSYFSGVATWSPDPYEIVIYTSKHRSKTEVILSIMHELSHHIFYLHNGKPDIPEAYAKEAARENSSSPSISKHERKKIYDYERLSIAYMLSIATELDLKIPNHKIELQMYIDTWMYEHYYNTGNFPTTKELAAKKKELKRK